MKTLAVIILNWNGIELLKQFIPAASRFSVSDEADLIVADNGSTDDSLTWLRKNHPEVKVIALDRNYGFAEGYNRAIKATGYPFTILLNSDVEVTEGWWQPLLRFMKKNPDVGAIQPKIKSFRNKQCFEYAGAAGGYLDRLGYPYCRGRLFECVEEDHGQYDGPATDICWASGAALMVRTDLYLQLGGLDPLFFAHMEEIDLCWRIKLAGYAVVVIPQSVVFHLGGGTLPPSNPRKTYLNFRNNLLLLHKNLPDSSRKKRLLVRRLYDALAWVKFVVSLDFADASAVLRAHRDFRKMRANYTSHPDVDLLPKSPDIVVDYYLRRRKVYSDLD